MDKQQISRQLYRLAEEEIPDTMNLWPRIQGQLKRKSKPRSFSLAYALSAFVMLSLVGLGGYIAYRSSLNINMDEEAVAPNQVTELGMIQTIGGVTISLDWAYADAHIVSIQYSIIFNPQEVTLADFSVLNLRTSDGLLLPQDFSGASGGGGGGGDATSMRFTNQANFDASAITNNAETLDLVLLIQNVESYEPNYEIQFQPTVPPPTAINEPNGDSFTATPIVMGIISAQQAINVRTGPGESYEAFVALPVGASMQVLGQTADGEWFNVRLEDGREGWISSTYVRIESSPTPIPYDMGTPSRELQATEIFTATPIPMNDGSLPTVPPPDMQIQPSLIPPMQFTPTPMPAIASDIFAFSFTVPFYPAKTGRVENASIASNGITLSIHNLSITPSMTNFELCYDMPDNLTAWNPQVSLDTGFAPSPFLQGSIPAISLDGGNRYSAQAQHEPLGQDRACLPMRSFAPFSPEGGTIEIDVDYLYRYADFATSWASDEAFFRERGFDLSYEFVAIAAGEEEAFYSQSRPSNVIVYPLPETGAILITLRDYPDSLEEWEAHSYIFDNMLRERVVGDWVFRVRVD